MVNQVQCKPPNALDYPHFFSYYTLKFFSSPYQNLKNLFCPLQPLIHHLLHCLCHFSTGCETTTTISTPSLLKPFKSFKSTKFYLPLPPLCLLLPLPPKLYLCASCLVHMYTVLSPVGPTVPRSSEAPPSSRFKPPLQFPKPT